MSQLYNYHCKHHSRAKGSKPVEKNIRSLAWVVVRWADQCRPRVIILENVREFEEWGPLVPRWECQCGWKGAEGQALLARTRRRCPRCESRSLKQTADMIPDPARLGLTFRRFAGRLRGLGYAVQWRTLNAHTATTKDRFGLVTVLVDGEPYVIADIGMRMLTPRELARAQGFPDEYKLTGTNTSQVARIGNSVSPNVARAIVGANFAGVLV